MLEEGRLIVTDEGTLEHVPARWNRRDSQDVLDAPHSWRDAIIRRVEAQVPLRVS